MGRSIGRVRRAGASVVAMTLVSGGALLASSSPSSASAKSLKAEVPANIRATGQLTDLVNSPYPPMEYQKTTGGPIVGFDIDIATAVAKVLGLKLVVTNTPNFSELSPAVTTSRVNIVDSSVFDFTSRHSTVHFVDDFTSGAQFLGLKSTSGSITTNAGLCGKTVMVQSGTSFAADIAALSKKVCPAGQKIATLSATALPDQMQQVKLGRAVALVQGPESNGYVLLTQPGKWHVIGTIFNPSLMGIMFNKSNTQLGIALRDAVNVLIKNGQYAKILAKWGLTGDGVKAATINHGSPGA